MADVRTEDYGRAVEWDSPDGTRYLWAVDRHWVQDVGAARQKIDAAVGSGDMGLLLSSSDFLTATRNPRQLLAALSTLELEDAELEIRRSELIADATHWVEVFERSEAERQRAATLPESGGCFTLVCLALLLAVTILLL